MLLEVNLDDLFMPHQIGHANVYAMLKYFCHTDKKHPDIISGTLSHSYTHVLRSTNASLSKQTLSSSKSHSFQKHINALSTIDLRAYLDLLAKVNFVGYNRLARSHLVRANWPKQAKILWKRVPGG